MTLSTFCVGSSSWFHDISQWLDRGIDLQRLDKKTGFTLLHLSCLWGSLENVMFLVGHGGSLLQRTRDGDSCLHLGNPEVCMLAYAHYFDA